MKKVSLPVIGIVSDYADHEIPPGFFNEIWNAQPLEGFSKTATQNVKGFTLKSETYPSGVNTCIGMYTDKINNRLFYFLHNSNSNHSIWYFNPIDDAHTLVMQTEFLNFSTDHPILSATFLDDILQWTDGENEARSILVSRAVANDLYDIASQKYFEKQVSLYKSAPSLPPTIFGRSTDSSITTNNIAADSFQFVAQYIFEDGSESDISPISALSPAEVFPVGVTNNNFIIVDAIVDLEIAAVVKSVKISFIKNGDFIYRICKVIERAGFVTFPFYTAARLNFYNTDIVEIHNPTYTNFISNKINNILIHDQRNYITLNEYDYPDHTSAVITATKTSRASSSKICCPNASYTVGLQFFDLHGRTNGIVAKTTVNFGNISKTKGDFTISASEQLNIAWSVSGDVPTWADTYSILLKKNNTYEAFYKTIAFPQFYLRTDTQSTTNVLSDGKVFYASAQNGWTKNIYLRIPENLAFELDTSFKVRLLNSLGQSREVENIIAIDGQYAIVGNFGILDWAVQFGGGSGTYGFINVAFEKPKSTQDELFYEVAQNFDCSDGTFSTPSGTIAGEYFYIDDKLSFTRNDNDISFAYGSTFGNVFDRDGATNVINTVVICESPTHANMQLEQIKTKDTPENKTSNILTSAEDAAGTLPIASGWVSLAKATHTNFIGNLGKTLSTASSVTTSDIKSVFSPDYTKKCNDFGRAFVEVNSKQQRSDPTLMSISDTFVIGTSINGLNKFRNVYSLPLNRTAIRKLVDIGQSNIFLSIGERSTTSLSTYTGDNILHTQDGNQLLGSGAGIIGYDRELAGGYGTLYPDSVTSYNRKAWWFDPYQGEVCRYSNNGISPIGSLYKMHNFFKEKGQQFIDTTGRNIVSGYDPELGILYMTFRSTNADEEVTVAFIDREGEERWYSFYEFLPDRYAYIGERLFSFKDGGLWEHKVNSTYGLFYGEQKTLSLNHKFNAEFSKPKFLANISLVSNDRWTVNPITTTNPEYGDQETRLAESNFVNKQGRFYADVKRDINTPVGMLPAGKSGLVAGRRCVGEIFDITLENNSTEKVELRSIEYGYVSESGHR